MLICLLLAIIVIDVVDCVYGSFGQPNKFLDKKLFNRLPDGQPHLFSEF